MPRIKELTEAQLAEIAGLHNYTSGEAARLAWEVTVALTAALVGAVKLTVRWTFQDVIMKVTFR